MTLRWKLGLMLVMAAAIGFFAVPWRSVGDGSGGSPPVQTRDMRSEGHRRDETLRLLTRDYVRLGVNVSPGMAAGRDLAPVEFLNRELGRQGAKWRVRKPDGQPMEWYDIS